MRIHILCFGNLIHGDDGFGIHLYQKAMQMQWPRDVIFYDAGIMGYGAINYFENCERVVVIDAMNLRSSAGQLHWLKMEDVAAPVEQFSMHAIDLTHLFHIVPLIIPEEERPDIDILAVEIQKCETFCETLSPEVGGSLDSALLEVKKFIDNITNEALL